MRPEIWALAFYEMHGRWSFDYKTDNLWLPDVEGAVRKVKLSPRLKFGAGKNFGWPCYEGEPEFSLDFAGHFSLYIPVIYCLHDVPTAAKRYRGYCLPWCRVPHALRLIL